MAAGTLTLSSTGDVVLLGALLGIAAGDVLAAAAAVLAALSFAVRWGATSLEAIAGAQSVLGPGGAVAPALAGASSWCGALALLLLSPRDWRAAAFGLAAAIGVAGPMGSSGADLAVRVAASAVGAGVALGVGRVVPPAVGRPAALGLAGLAAVLAVVS